MKLFLPIFFVASAAVFSGTAIAQTQVAPVQNERAVTAASDFIAKFEEGDLGELYDRSTTATFRALMSKELFVQQGGVLRMQSGGRALARELVGAQAFSQLPNGTRGTYQYVRFRTRHPNGLVFQDIYLEEGNGQWKVNGFNLLPAPQQ